jgi:hypothetical protein
MDFAVCWSQTSGLYCSFSCEIFVCQACCMCVEVTLLNNVVHISGRYLFLSIKTPTFTSNHLAAYLAMCVSFASFHPYFIHLSVHHSAIHPWPCSSCNSVTDFTDNIVLPCNETCNWAKLCLWARWIIYLNCSAILLRVKSHFM